MAKKKARKAAKKKAKKPSKPKSKRSASGKKPKALPTAFLSGLYATVITRPNDTPRKPAVWAWPPKLEAHSTSYVTIGDVITMLGNSIETSTPPVPDGSGSFQDKVAAYASTYPWPTSADYLKYTGGSKASAPSVNLYEIDRIADLMFDAIDAGGDGTSGGGGRRWPPIG